MRKVLKWSRKARESSSIERRYCILMRAFLFSPRPSQFKFQSQTGRSVCGQAVPTQVKQTAALPRPSRIGFGGALKAKRSLL